MEVASARVQPLMGALQDQPAGPRHSEVTGGRGVARTGIRRALLREHATASIRALDLRLQQRQVAASAEQHKETCHLAQPGL